jgi:hypothetical protein
VSFRGAGATFENTEMVWVGYGQEADYQNVDVKNKVVVVQLGTVESRTPQEIFDASNAKTLLAKARGASAIVEVFGGSISWSMAVRYFNSDRIALSDGNGVVDFPHFWVGSKRELFKKDNLRKLSAQVPPRNSRMFHSCNVVGVLEGSDPKLKNEYVILSAHYDHIGTGKDAGGAFTEVDSIFNGTRDNIFGVAGLLTAAQYLSQKPPKRSILLVAFTAEEVGLLGSRYYAQHPLVPLKDCVFNLNCDNAGYNDTGLVTVIGLPRTEAQGDLLQAAKALGLRAVDDPAPEQGLFDRSDNVHFASKGIPSPTFSAGFTKFDESLFKYYHQASDNPETVDMAYLLKYCQSYTLAARLIANRARAPRWTAGDKYEATGKKLYGY